MKNFIKNCCVKETGWGEITLHPDSNGPKYRPIRIWVTPDVANEVLPDRVSIGKDKKGNYIITKEKKSDDNRILVAVWAEKPGHRKHGFICKDRSTGTILATSSGYGAWGSGEVCLAILDIGQQIVTVGGNWLTVTSWDGEKLSTIRMSEAEFEGQCGVELEEL